MALLVDQGVDVEDRAGDEASTDIYTLVSLLTTWLGQGQRTKDKLWLFCGFLFVLFLFNLETKEE